MKFPIPTNNGVPFIANLDSTGNVTVPTEQYIISGGLYVPVSAANPLPTATIGSLPAGTNAIGTVGVTTLPELPSGANVIGKMGIDPANNVVKIDNTTNTVKDNDAGNGATGVTIPAGGLGKLGWMSGIYDRLSKVVLAAGTAIIGKVGIDQTTDGTTNRVVSKISQISGENTITIASGQNVGVVAGSAIMGKVGIDQASGQNIVSFGANAQPVSITESLPNVVADEFNGSTTVTRTYATNHTRLEICNDDGASSLTFTVDSLSGRIFTVLPGEVREYDFPSFKVIAITTTVAYRATVMGGTAEVGVSS